MTDQKDAAMPVAWLHEISEPQCGPSKMFSASPDNPWSHWVASHLETCTYKSTPLYASHSSRIGVLEKALRDEREVIAAKAREWAGHYEPHSDGRNTFVLFAEWIEARATLAVPSADRSLVQEK